MPGTSMSATNGRAPSASSAALIAFQRLPNAAVLDHRRQRAAELGRLDQLDRVDDFHIAGAAAQMPVESLRDFGPR